MNLLNEILSWSEKTLPAWQQDAVRRLFQKGSIDAQDMADLYALMKQAHGLPDASGRQPVPFAAQHLPQQGGRQATIILKSMRDLRNVNRLAEGQVITFASAGVTIIYDDNGAGKSGYSRVLKKACRARDASDEVLTDAFDPQSVSAVPEATFDVECGSKTTQVCWKRADPAPDELSTVAVFDGKCALAYVDAEQDVAYSPYGLDVVESLAQKVLAELARTLDIEIQSLSVDRGAFADLEGSTKVGKALAALGPKTQAKEIDTLTTLSDEERTRFVELEKMLRGADPIARAKELRLSGKRVADLLARTNLAVSSASDSVVAFCSDLWSRIAPFRA